MICIVPASGPIKLMPNGANHRHAITLDDHIIRNIDLICVCLILHIPHSTYSSFYSLLLFPVHSHTTFFSHRRQRNGGPINPIAACLPFPQEDQPFHSAHSFDVSGPQCISGWRKDEQSTSLGPSLPCYGQGNCCSECEIEQRQFGWYFWRRSCLPQQGFS